MKFQKIKQTRVLILIMTILVICAVLVASWYYNAENKSVDPRVVRAHEMYEKYNSLAEHSDYENIFLLMDSIEEIYADIDHYKESYEVGVLYNNRAAAYLSMALDSNNSDQIIKDSLFQLAEMNVLKSIDLYSKWLEEWEDKPKNEVQALVSSDFQKDDQMFKNKSNLNNYIRKRTKQIADAQFETKRRLSVSYTNLGIIFRHRNDFENAAKQYFHALQLWPDNLAAENNLNILFGKKQKKQSVMRYFFPKSRKEDK